MIFDKNGNAPTFYKHKHTLRNFWKDMVAVTAGKVQKLGALEELRNGLVHSMKTGDTLAIYLKNLAPDFKNDWKDDKVWPINEISDFDEWREDEKYMKIVNDKENVGLTGDKGNYILQESHTMVFVSKYQNDEHMLEVMKGIPNSDMMQVIITIPQEEEAALEQKQKQEE